MDRRTPFIADIQPPKATQPGLGALHYPAVAPQSLGRLDPFARAAAADAPPPEGLPTVRGRVRLVGMPLGRASAWATTGALDGLKRVPQGLEPADVVAIGRRQLHRERDALAVDHKRALRARFAAIRRIRAGGVAPLYIRDWRRPQRPPRVGGRQRASCPPSARPTKKDARACLADLEGRWLNCGAGPVGPSADRQGDPIREAWLLPHAHA
jgi:hypothetical protein